MNVTVNVSVNTSHLVEPITNLIPACSRALASRGGRGVTFWNASKFESGGIPRLLDLLTAYSVTRERFHLSRKELTLEALGGHAGPIPDLAK